MVGLTALRLCALAFALLLVAFSAPAQASAVPAIGPVEAAAPTALPVPQAHERRGRRCPKGYRKVFRKGRWVCKRKQVSTTPTPTPTPTPDPAALQQEILNDTFSLATEYAEEKIHGPSSLPRWYRYLIYPEDCKMVSSDTGQCLVYVWQETYASGYGWGGYERAIWREHYMATRIAPRLYQPRIVMIDFLDPYRWECADPGYQNVPPCS